MTIEVIQKEEEVIVEVAVVVVVVVVVSRSGSSSVRGEMQYNAAIHFADGNVKLS